MKKLKQKWVIKANATQIDKDRRLVFGWASVAIDKSGEVVEDCYEDVIDIQDLEVAAYEFTLHFRVLNAEHDGPDRGALIESMVFTKEKMDMLGIPEGTLHEGWWVGFYVEDDDTWNKVKKGDFQMFSIEGWANRQEI